CKVGRDTQCQAGLPDTARPRKRDLPCPAEESLDAGELLLASDEAGQWRWQIVAATPVSRAGTTERSRWASRRPHHLRRLPTRRPKLHLSTRIAGRSSAAPASAFQPLQGQAHLLGMADAYHAALPSGDGIRRRAQSGGESGLCECE